MITYVLLILGFFLLIKGADCFVEGSSSVAKLLHIPSTIIGLTVVAFGTSMPEASVSVSAALQKHNSLAVSNVLGSNIFNLLIVLGTCAVISRLPVKKTILKKELPFSIFITVLLMAFILFQDKTLTRMGGLVLLALFVLFLLFTCRDAMKARSAALEANEKPEDYKVLSPLLSAVYIIVGLAAIILGGNLVVESASAIAKTFGLSETFIGLTIVAMGTSLPELVTSIVAATKGENGIAIGNVVGSNIFNILLILGISAAITPIPITTETVYDIVILLAASLYTLFTAWKGKSINRLEGAGMLAIYAAFAVYITIR